MPEPFIVSESNISIAWGRLLAQIHDNAGKSISPAIIRLHSPDQNGVFAETNEIRVALDGYLDRKNHANGGYYSTKIVAFTIFPQSFWLIEQPDRQRFYDRYLTAVPRFKGINTINRDGLYFERMINYEDAKTNTNQLEFMIEEYRRNARRASKFQAITYDVRKDQHRRPYQTFPCLQTVSFTFPDGGLSLNAFYAMQYLEKRAYGNMLGLTQLGAFMAATFGVPLLDVNIFVGIEKHDETKASMKPILDIVRPFL